jgi:uracil-DNA glycosylase
LANRLRIDASTLAPGWAPLWQDFSASSQGIALLDFLSQRQQAGATIFPPVPLRAFELTPFDQVRVVVIGQDPYHGAGQAHGLAFSVPDGLRPPPSLRNIFVELQRDLGCVPPASGNLEHWTRQGVLLTNAVFTVEEGQPGSHAGRGWEAFADRVIGALAADRSPKVFLLWGAYAQAKAAAIAQADQQLRHKVLQANHPSPLSARRPPVPFLGCGHFSAASAFLSAQGRGAIDWCGNATSR